MREIAATQEATGLTPALFEAIAEIYESMAETPRARENPEDVRQELSLEDVLAGLP